MNNAVITERFESLEPLADRVAALAATHTAVAVAYDPEPGEWTLSYAERRDEEALAAKAAKEASA